MNNNKMISSPQARLTALSASFKDVLKLGRHYVELLDQLAETEDAQEMLAATTQLAELDLQNTFVDFPQHYQAADYYLIFMGRLLEKMVSMLSRFPKIHGTNSSHGSNRLLIVIALSSSLVKMGKRPLQSRGNKNRSFTLIWRTAFSSSIIRPW